MITTYFFTYSDNYNSNNQGSFSSRQLNNRGFPFGVLKQITSNLKAPDLGAFLISICLESFERFQLSFMNNH